MKILKVIADLMAIVALIIFFGGMAITDFTSIKPILFIMVSLGYLVGYGVLLDYIYFG